MINELSEREARELLRVKRLGRLGCCAGSEPYVVPINYLLEGNNLYIHSLPGRKIQMLRANPRACLQVDEIEDDYHWRSVIVYGIYEEIQDGAERDRVLAEMFKHLPHLTPVESEMRKGIDEIIAFRLRITSLTGVYEKW